jgi:hypothetical protein
MQTILKLKINLIQNTLNFLSIQWNYLLSSPISWDYLVKGIFSPKFSMLLLVPLESSLTIFYTFFS